MKKSTVFRSAFSLITVVEQCLFLSKVKFSKRIYILVIKVVIGMVNSFNLKCKHERYCHPWCFERVYRQCYRLTEALRKVYGDDLPSENRLDKSKALIDSWNSKQETMRKVIICIDVNLKIVVFLLASWLEFY